MSSDRSRLRRSPSTGSQSLLRLPVALLFAIATAGCPGSLENKSDFLGGGGAGGGAAGPSTGSQGGAPADDPCNGLITKRCATSTCHVAGVTPPNLSYEGRVERIRDVEANNGCGLLVDTSAPEESLIYRKCADLTPECGSRMPLSGDRLDEEDLACLLDWIETL